MKENSLKMQEAEKGCWMEGAEPGTQVGGLLAELREFWAGDFQTGLLLKDRGEWES